LTPAEVGEAYEAMLKVPEFGVKLAMALQFAAKMTTAGKMGTDRMLDAAVVPAFLVGILVGSSKPEMEVPSFDKQMARLERCVGVSVRIDYISDGRSESQVVDLQEVEPYVLLKYSGGSMPFIGSGIAIRRVTLVLGGWEDLIYFNPKVTGEYNILRKDEVEKFRVEAWGPLAPLKKKA
jgi:hypothetical protein